MLQQMPSAVRGILIANVIFFVLTLSLGDYMYLKFSLWFMENPRFGFWQFASHMFMHGGFTHILFNMYALVAFGSPLERQWGREKFIFFFFSAGLGAAFLHTGVNFYFFNEAVSQVIESGISRIQLFEALNSINGLNLSYIEQGVSYEVAQQLKSSFYTPAVGASGAVYGVLVAFAFMYPEARLMLLFLPFPIKAKYFVPLIILGDLYFGITNQNTGIAHFAHIGGALLGFIMMWYWNKNSFDNHRWDS
jgi:membrane associated rhomboid family serine protease